MAEIIDIKQWKIDRVLQKQKALLEKGDIIKYPKISAMWADLMKNRDEIK